MRRALLALALCAALAAQSRAPARAEDPARGQESVQSLFDEGAKAAAAQDHARAIDRYSAALRALAAQGRGAGADAGLVASRLARSLKAVDHPQTDEVLAFAVKALARVEDAAPFLDSALTLLERIAPRDAAQAGDLVGAVLDRLALGLPVDQRDRAVAALLSSVDAAGREDLALSIYERVGALPGEGDMLLMARGAGKALRARAAEKEGRLREARALIEEALDPLRRGDLKRGLALALGQKARLAYLEGAYAQGLPVAREAEALLRGDARDRPLLVEALGLAARLLERLERPGEAVALFESAEASFSPQTPQDERLRDAMRLDRVGFLIRAGRLDQARALLQSEAERHGGQAHWAIGANFHEQIAALRLAENDFAGAGEAAAKAIALYVEKTPQTPALRIEPTRKLAEALLGGDDAAAAERALRDLVALTEGVFSPSHPEVARDLSVYATWLREQDRLSEAEAVQRRVAAILDSAYGPGAPKHAYALGNLALTLAAAGRPAEARDLLTRGAEALAAREGDGDDVAAKRVQMLAALGEMERLLGRPRAALGRLDQAVAAIRARPGFAMTYALKSLIDGPAAAALLDLGEIAEAGRLTRDLLALDPPTREDAANANKTRLIAALIAERGGDGAAALDLARAAGAQAEKIGQSERAFTLEWAGLLARLAFARSRKPGAPPR